MLLGQGQNSICKIFNHAHSDVLLCSKTLIQRYGFLKML